MVIYQKPTNRNNLLNFDVLLRHQTIFNRYKPIDYG